jgi:hypothetical protein
MIGSILLLVFVAAGLCYIVGARRLALRLLLIGVAIAIAVPFVEGAVTVALTAIPSLLGAVFAVVVVVLVVRALAVRGGHRAHPHQGHEHARPVRRSRAEHLAPRGR